MDTNKHEFEKTGEKLLLKDEVYQIVGCAMEVLNGVGHVILNFKHSKLEWERIVL